MGIFDGKVAIVTGGASGIGRSVGIQLARRGAKVVLADLNTTMLDGVVKEIKEAGGSVRGVALDVTNREAVKKLVDETVAEHGRLDYIFNNAGIGVGGEAHDFEFEDWKKVIDINLFGVVHGVFAAYPIMIKQGFGHIVNTSSLAGVVPFPGEISYTTSKYAVVGLSHVLRTEGANLGVKVSVVCPGIIRTPIYTNSKLHNMDREKFLSIMPKGVSADECASVILRGIERNKPTIVVTKFAVFLWWLHRFFPWGFQLFARQAVKEMRKLRIDKQ